MSEYPEKPPVEWNLGDWERALTIRVGSAYACRECEGLVMITRGGVGVLDLVCCGKPMEKVGLGRQGPQEGADA